MLLHKHIIARTGGAEGLHDLAGLESAVAQPRMTFGGEELYPTLTDQASALMFSLVLNHPFVDGNKRVGYAAAELFLWLNGYELDTNIDDAEQTVLRLAAGDLERETLQKWIAKHCISKR